MSQPCADTPPCSNTCGRLTSKTGNRSMLIATVCTDSRQWKIMVVVAVVIAIVGATDINIIPGTVTVTVTATVKY